MRIPKETSVDSTLALRRDPYRFVSKRCDAHGADLFGTRLLLQQVICMRGAAAAELFYDRSRFRRADALPGHVVKLLFGEGGVQGLDGEAHELRKSMHLSLMSRDRMDLMERILARRLREASMRWHAAEDVTLYPELIRISAEAAFEWSGMPEAPDWPRRAEEMRMMFERAGAAGPRYWQGRAGRQRAEDWAGALVARVRAETLTPPAGSALEQVPRWHDEQGRLLPEPIAAVELLNVLRPLAAVGVWMVYVVHALALGAAAPHSDSEVRRFVMEVRRHYPFFPMVGARTCQDFDWKGYHIPRGRLVLLDIWGTNHDPRLWDAPEAFDPERFRDRAPSAFDLIPQGGGDHADGHRCPGEWITERMMAVALRFFAQEYAWQVPAQRLDLNERRLPARPRDGLRIVPVDKIASASAHRTSS